ncbi:MAG: permease-like cell division protein FtsX [Pseudomonadota bacterium]
MKLLYFKHAFNDIVKSRFLHIVAIITLAFSVIITSSIILFFKNTTGIFNIWKKGVKVMVYLSPETADEAILEIQKKISGMYGVKNAIFIPKEEALNILKQQMKRQPSLLENLKGNPLPNAFEIHLIESSEVWEKIESLVAHLELIPQVEEVEYGQKWLARFAGIINIFTLSGYTLGILFFIASVFIVANTVRLVLYAKRDEIEIMRLVGASDSFIKTPLYIECIIQGAAGGIIGLVLLYIIFTSFISNVGQGMTSDLINISFFSFSALSTILICSMFIGWLGCFLSLKNFLKN